MLTCDLYLALFEIQEFDAMDIIRNILLEEVFALVGLGRSIVLLNEAEYS